MGGSDEHGYTASFRIVLDWPRETRPLAFRSGRGQLNVLLSFPRL